MILAGDIGGTKVLLGLFERAGGGLTLVAEERYASRALPSLEDGLQAFLTAQAPARVDVACLGVAGAVIGGRCHTTNLPWTLEETAMAQRLGLRRVKLLNDVEATACGMLQVGDADLVALNPAAPGRGRGNIGLLSVGTGLGEGMLYWDGSTYHPIASEGGHGDFAARTEQEVELLRFLRRRLGGRVSYERVIAGPGLFNIYSFLRDTGFAAEPGWLTAQLQQGDPSAAVSAAALEAGDPLSREALALFCSILGAEAGNMVLRCLASGGIYLAGGVPPKILPALGDGRMLAAFVDKGRFEELLRRTPVFVSMDPRAPLLGAAHYGARLE
jgi:glucokinase